MKPTVFFVHTVNMSTNPQQVLSVARAWRQKGFRVVMFAPWERMDQVHEPITIVRVPAPPTGHLRTIGFGFCLAFLLPLFALFLRPQMIYSRQTYLEIFPVILVKLLFKTKYVLNINGWRKAEIMQTEGYSTLHRFSELLYTLSYKLSDFVVSVTPEIAQAISKTYSYDPNKIVAIGNGVNLSFFKPQPRLDALARLGLSADYEYLLFSGSFKKWHGLTFGIEMFSKLLSLEKKARLLIVGSSGPDKDKTVEASTRELTQELTKSKAIVLTGFVDPTRVPLYINAATICLTFHPDLALMKYGLTPLKIPEYMACRKAIVCTKVGGLDAFVEKYKCGVSAQPGNVDDYVSKVQYLLNNRDNREQFAENGYRAAVEYLDWNKIAQRILEFTRVGEVG